jgi:hypothetical protein
MQLAGKIPWSWLFPSGTQTSATIHIRMLISLVVPLSPFERIEPVGDGPQ